MNNNNEIIWDTFASVIESLEKFIEKSNFYPDWSERKQNHNNTIKRTDIDSPEKAKSLFCTIFLYGLKIMLGFPENKSFPKPELKEKFYQWIDAVKIKADNCPTELIPLLYHTHEVLEGRGEEFAKKLTEMTDRKFSRMSKEEKEKGWKETISEVNKQHGKIENGETEWKGLHLKGGNAEAGKEIFQKIIATVDNYDIFPPEEITPDDSSEAQAAIKELKGLLEKKWNQKEAGEEPSYEICAKLNRLEKIIQDLENFESNTTANGGKNKYAWVKLGAGGKLETLKITKLDLEGKLLSKKDTPISSGNKSPLFPKAAIISVVLFFILGIILVFYIFWKKKKKKD